MTIILDIAVFASGEVRLTIEPAQEMFDLSEMKYEVMQVLQTNPLGDIQVVKAVTGELLVLKRSDINMMTSHAMPCIENDILRAFSTTAKANGVPEYRGGGVVDQWYCTLTTLEMGDLMEYLTTRHRLSESRAVYHFRHVAETVNVLHEMGYFHADISPENLLISKCGKLKLCDFGLTQAIIPAVVYPTCGKIGYAAPEILMTHLQGNAYNPIKADVFSLGVCFFIALFGVMPFNCAPAIPHENHFYAYFMKHGIRGLTSQFKLGSIRPLLLDLLDNMMTYNHVKRPCMQEVIQILQCANKKK